MPLSLTKKILVLDAETSSPIDLKARGQYTYWDRPETRTLMLGYKWLGGSSTELVDFETGGQLPVDIVQAIQAPPEECMLAAANAPFDQAALRQLGYDTPDEKWLDILIAAYILGFSGRLDDVLKQTPLQIQKDPEGTRLITLFSVQRKPWYEYPSKWQKFRDYCIHDADVEEQLLRWCLQWLDGSDSFRAMTRHIHQQDLIYRRINRRGIPIDRGAVRGALQIRDRELAILVDEMSDITGLENPNSRDQLLEWINLQGSQIQDLQKDTVRDELLRLEALGRGSAKDPLYQALVLRQELGKTSTAKFDALDEATSADNRLRGGWQFYGASRSGRVAGRRLNPANLARPQVPSPESVAEIMALGDGGLLRACFPEKPLLATLSSTIRACVQAPEGMELAIADLSSIESVGAAWLAGCQSVLDTFHAGRDTYKEMAAACEGIPYEEVTKSLRTDYKPAVLGGIYRLSGPGLMGYAASMGIDLDEERADQQIARLRAEWHEIVHYWDQLQDAAFNALGLPHHAFEAKAVDRVLSEWTNAETGRPERLYSYKDWPRVTYWYDGTFLFCRIPSGRLLCYYEPRIELTEIPYRGKTFKTLSLTYMGNNQKLPGSRWQRLSVHSGHQLENINQAMCRDILWIGLEQADADPDMEVLGDVYDEIWTEIRAGDRTAYERLVQYMTDKSKAPWLNDDFFLGADGYIAKRQKKG